MKITIVQDDGVVGIDGEFRQVDLSSLDPLIHAIQFDTTKDRGHIEYDEDESGKRQPNLIITDIAAFQPYIDAWNALTPQPAPEPTFEELKEAKRKAINAERDLRETQGFSYNGALYDCDQRSVDRIFGASLAAIHAKEVGSLFFIDWTTADNQVVTLNATQVMELANSLALHAGQLHETARELKALVGAATTKEQLDGIVWPQ